MHGEAMVMGDLVLGCELNDKILGVVGLGRIGSNVARKAIGLGMRVIAYDPFIDPATAKGHEFEILAKPVHPTDLLAKLRG